MTRTAADLLGADLIDPNALDAKTLAGVLGVVVRTVNKLATDGLIPRAENHTFDLGASVQAYLAFKSRSNSADRERREKAEADLAEAKAAKVKGELVPAADAEATWTGICRDIRSGLLAVPSRVRARVPSLTSAEVSIMDSEIRLALTALGDANE